MDLLINALLFIYILLVFTYDGTLIVYIIGLSLILLIFFTKIIKSKEIRINITILLMSLFLIITIGSILYAVDQNVALSRVISLLFNFFIMVGIINYLDTKEKVDFVQKAFVFSGLTLGIILFINADLATNYRLGTDVGSINRMGIMLAFSFIFSVYYLIKTKKIVNIIYVLFLMSVILLLGSRQTLIFIVFSLIISYMFYARFNIIKQTRAIILTIVGLLTLFFVTTRIDYFHFIERRFTSLFDFLREEQTREGSINARSDMMSVGLEFFSQNPLMGFGIDNYQALYQITYGVTRYSHNNYIELLVGVGIIGTLVYYAIYVYELKDLVRIKNSIDPLLRNIYIGMVFSILLIGVSTVYYSIKIIFIIIALYSSYNNLNKKSVYTL